MDTNKVNANNGNSGINNIQKYMNLYKAYIAGLEYGACWGQKDFHTFKAQEERDAWWLGFEESIPGSNLTIQQLIIPLPIEL